MKISSFAAAVVCSGIFFLTPAQAQEDTPPQGSYLTYIGGRHIMTETYRVASQPDGSIVTEGEIMPAAGGAKQKVVTKAAKMKPDSFSFEVGGVKATMDDFRNWRAALANHKEIEFKSYPKLDHLFYEGESAASGADYAQPRNIPKYVIEDIAAWVKKQ